MAKLFIKWANIWTQKLGRAKILSKTLKYYKIDNIGRAEQEFLKSISLRNTFVPALYNLAKTYQKSNQLDKARDLARKIITLRHDHKLTRKLAEELGLLY